MGPTATKISLVWEHDLILSGQVESSAGAPTVRMMLDSASVAGPSPVQALAFSLLGCMAMDLVHILMKGRHDLRGLRAELQAARAPEHPRRLTHVELHYTIVGAVPPEHIERAIALSREKYCSVWHSLRQDIDLDVTFTVSAGL